MNNNVCNNSNNGNKPLTTSIILINTRIRFPTACKTDVFSSDYRSLLDVSCLI